MMDLCDCYVTLGLKPGASLDRVKSAYRKLAKEWHPDLRGHDALLQQIGDSRMKEINEAYQTLLEFLSFHTSPFQHVYSKSTTTPKKESDRDPATDEERRHTGRAEKCDSHDYDHTNRSFFSWPAYIVGYGILFPLYLIACSQWPDLRDVIYPKLFGCYLILMLIVAIKR